MEDDRDRQKKAREESWMMMDTDESEFKMALSKAQLITRKDLELFETIKAKYDSSMAEYKAYGKV